MRQKFNGYFHKGITENVNILQGVLIVSSHFESISVNNYGSVLYAETLPELRVKSSMLLHCQAARGSTIYVQECVNYQFIQLCHLNCSADQNGQTIYINGKGIIQHFMVFQCGNTKSDSSLSGLCLHSGSFAEVQNINFSNCAVSLYNPGIDCYTKAATIKWMTCIDLRGILAMSLCAPNPPDDGTHKTIDSINCISSKGNAVIDIRYCSVTVSNMVLKDFTGIKTPPYFFNFNGWTNYSFSILNSKIELPQTQICANAEIAQIVAITGSSFSEKNLNTIVLNDIQCTYVTHSFTCAEAEVMKNIKRKLIFVSVMET